MKRRARPIELVLGSCLLLASGACGADESGTGPSETRSTESAEPAAKKASGSSRRGRSTPGSGAGPVVTVVSEGGEGPTGVISGVALFEGEAPERAPISAVGNTTGCEAHAEPVLNESLIVNDGKLQNVFVYIDRGLEKWEPTPIDETPAVMDQTGCMYAPHVMGLRAGRALHALNSDAIAHNVHVVADRNQTLNQTQAGGAQPIDLVFDRAEVPVTFVCDIHNWMKAYVCVVESPFFAVTDANGRFSIEGVPPGAYRLRTWHERRSFARQEAEVDVTAGGEIALRFTFSD